VRYRVRLPRALGRDGVVWTTFGPGLASFAGAALFSIDGATRSHLAGSRTPQSALGGDRRRVRMTIDGGEAVGWIDDRERYRHPIDLTQPVRIAFHVERGVQIDVRDLVVEGGLE
jgi:hypothetical protein